MFTPKADQTAEQQLKVQRLAIRSDDPAMYSSASGTTYILIREPVDRIYLVAKKNDAANTSTLFNQANCSIVDSVALTPGGDQGAIAIAGLSSLSTNDVVVVEYTVQLS